MNSNCYLFYFSRKGLSDSPQSTEKKKRGRLESLQKVPRFNFLSEEQREEFVDDQTDSSTLKERDRR